MIARHVEQYNLKTAARVTNLSMVNNLLIFLVLIFDSETIKKVSCKF